ncbi:MAG: aminoacyl-tRNA hydrolase [Bacteroidia bacterium]|nr:aminoacyl-tRNA hydrolase [Bacteroidia bacterium]
MKYLIAGLGNIGDEYAHTRHNIGFDIADEMVAQYKGSFTQQRYADLAEISISGRQLFVIKPNTYMNLSGKAVRHWMQELKLKPENIFVVVDDLAITFGKIRIRGNGSDAGHNGLKSITELLLTQNYPRLRFGIGSNFPKGRQIDFVLGKWDQEEAVEILPLMNKSVKAIENFVMRGIADTMSNFNK